MGRSVRAAAGIMMAAGIFGSTLFSGGAALAVPDAAGDPSDKLSGRLSEVVELDLSTDPAEASAQIDAEAVTLGKVGAGPASLQVSAEGIAVTVTYRTPPTAADIDALARLGTVDDVAAKYLVVGATVPAAALPEVAALPNVRRVVETVSPVSSGGTRFALASASAADDDCRSVPANLVEPLDVPAAWEKYDVDGSGIRVGIISDSYDTATDAPTTAEDDILSGVLPGPGNPCGWEQPVEVVQDAPFAASDEGRAMAQLIHSIAPGATLLFASGVNGQVGFANAVEKLIAAGSDIIVDDLGYVDELMFQNGVAANAVTDAAALGIPFFTAAGNDTSLATVGPSTGNVISSWEAPAYRPMDCPEVIDALLEEDDETGDCLDFSPTGAGDPTNTLTYPNLSAQETTTAEIMLQWAQPDGASDTRLIAAVIDPDTDEIVGLTPIQPLGTPWQVAVFEPVKGDTRTGGDYDFVVVRVTTDGVPASLPRVKAIFLGSYLRGAEHFRSDGGDLVGPSIYGHAGTPATMSIVAANAETPSTLEYFSGTGPTTLYFEPFPGTSPLPEPISGAPDVTSLDGGWTSFFGGPVADLDDTYSFTGTSAAAPSAAAVAALALQYDPELTPDQIRELLTVTADPITTVFPGVRVQDAAGAGRVNAEALLDAIAGPTPTPTPTPEPTPTPTASASAVPMPAAIPAGTRRGALPQTGTDGAAAFVGIGVGAALLAVGAGAVLVARRRRRDRV